MGYMRAAALTHRGAVRGSNEDCVAIDTWVAQRSMSAPAYIEIALDEIALCLICDGMGGHAAGEVASLIAVRGLIEKSRGFGDADQASAALVSANQAIFDAAQDQPELVGMGTTVAGIALGEGEALVFNVGDSRVYLQNGDYLRLLSSDDTPAAAYAGSHERTGQSSHGLLQCLGGARTFKPVSPHVMSLPLRPAEGALQTFDARFLLCSDGLTDMLDQDAIEACLRPNLVASCQTLFESAMREGGQDNISVIVVEYSAAAFARPGNN